MEQTLYEIAKSLRLSYDEYMQLRSDVVNLRGNEWWEEVFSNCPSSLCDDFYDIIKTEDD